MCRRQVCRSGLASTSRSTRTPARDAAPLSTLGSSFGSQPAFQDAESGFLRDQVERIAAMLLRPLLDEELSRALDRRQRALDAAALPHLDWPHRDHGGFNAVEISWLPPSRAYERSSLDPHHRGH